jgi:cysteinyl-tRNA synthetase
VQGLWTLADAVRARLTAVGIEVRDTPEGVVWLLVSDQSGEGGPGLR